MLRRSFAGCESEKAAAPSRRTICCRLPGSSPRRGPIQLFNVKCSRTSLLKATFSPSSHLGPGGSRLVQRTIVSLLLNSRRPNDEQERT